MSTNEVSVDEIKAMAGEMARHDDAFRKELIANPRAAVEKMLGRELPPQITIKTVEEAPDTYVIGVPSKPTVGEFGELSDGDLEAVAGGSKAGATKFFKDLGSAMVGAGAGQGATKWGRRDHLKDCIG